MMKIHAILLALLVIVAHAGKDPVMIDDTTGAVATPTTINFTNTNFQRNGIEISNHKETITTSAPTVTDDSDSNYTVGSRWMNTTTGDIYVATDVTVGAAVWTQINAASGDVVGPAGGVVDGEVALFNGTTGKIVKGSSGITFPLDSMDLGTDSVAADEIATGAVGSSELATDAVTAAAIATDAVDSDEIATDAVTTTEILDGTIVTADIAADTILAGNIATGAVATDEILDGTITAADLAADSVGASEIAAGAVGASEIAADAVGASELAATAVTPGAYTTADITVDADGRITAAANGASAGEANTMSNIGAAGVGVYKQKTGVDFEVKKINAGSGAISITDDTGNDEIDIDVPTGGINATHIATDGVDSAEIAADAVGASEIASGAVGASELASTAVTPAAYTLGGGSITVDADGRLTDATAGGRTGVYRTLWIPAGAFAPRDTNGAAFVSEEYATNDIQVDTYLFDPSTVEAVYAQIVFPSAYGQGTVKAKVFWDVATSGSLDVVWRVAGGALSNDDAIDAALGTAQSVTDTVTAVGDLHTTAATSAITIGGTPADGDMIIIEVNRHADDVGDTCTVDAKFIGVLIQYQESSTEPSAW